MENVKDIVFVGLSPWFYHVGSNSKDIARVLSKQYRILYMNPPLDNRTALQQRDHPEIRKYLDIINGKQPNLIEKEPNIWNYYPTKIITSARWLPFTPLFSIVNRINNRRFASDIRTATKLLGFSDYILFNDNDIFRSFYLKELLEPLLYIYYSRDNLVAMPYWKKHGARLEPLHIAKADLAVANSLYLTDYLRRYNPNSHYIGQGCDIGVFDASIDYPMPDDLLAVSHPIIGYIGAITSMRLDQAVIREIAVSRPNYNIVMVGPEDEDFIKSDLHNYPNIHFLGRKPLEELPRYSSRFDVCINPQLLNEVTVGNYPLKIDEYLAMGKPIVATHTRAMELFGDAVMTAEKPADYPDLIDKAMAEDNIIAMKKRIALAHTHTWENSVTELLAAIENTAPTLSQKRTSDIHP
ncbi:MAG TPA: glycosyltransferase [Puia sp.]|nr:glycosyltransferase [Puia sp.]